MRAVVCKAWGGPETLEIGELPEPEAGSGEVVIEVAAAGVNFADTLMVRGEYQEKPPFPFAPGLEAAGTILAVGPGVDRGLIGQAVLAITDSGSFAERARARASDCFTLPAGMDFSLAAGFPVTYGTAHCALAWHGRLQAGETLLVNGAAGGVGLAAVEVGKAMGARVIATAGGKEKLALARAHGADEAIDYKSEDLRERVKALTEGRGADVVFDPVGGDIFDASLRATAWGGRLLVIGFAGGRVQQIPGNLLLVKNVAAMGVYWGSYRQHAPERLAEEFAQLFTWWSAGMLKPHVSHRLPLERVAEALRLLTERRAAGKVVLTTRVGEERP